MVDKVPVIEEIKKEAIEAGKNIPNVEEKRVFTEIRGYVIEFAIGIERLLNELITKTGKDLVIDHEKKEFHLIKGIRDKRESFSFKTKTREMLKLIAAYLNSVQETDNLRVSFDRFISIRDIFAHVPLDFGSEKLEFDTSAPYKHFFKDPNWKKAPVALNEFMGIYEYLTNVILIYSKNIQLKKEIYSRIFFGMGVEDFQKKADRMSKKKK